MIESRKIRYFLAAAKHLHFSAAAAELHISQPALSRSIRELERTLGVPLFDRTPSGVVLTRYGELLARRARLMRLEAEHALAEIGAMKSGTGGRLRVGGGPVWVNIYLPPVICALHRQYPGVRVEITAGVIDTLVPELLNGKLDLFCGSLDFPSHPELVKVRLLDVKNIVIARVEHPIFGRENIEVEDLTLYPWIALKGDYVGRNKIGGAFVARNLKPPTATAIVSPGAGGFGLLALGDYLASYPEPMLPYAERFGLRRVPVHLNLWESRHGLVYREGSYVIPQVAALVGLVKNELAECQPAGSIEEYPVGLEEFSLDRLNAAYSESEI